MLEANHDMLIKLISTGQSSMDTCLSLYIHSLDFYCFKCFTTTGNLFLLIWYYFCFATNLSASKENQTHKSHIYSQLAQTNMESNSSLTVVVNIHTIWGLFHWLWFRVKCYRLKTLQLIDSTSWITTINLSSMYNPSTKPLPSKSRIGNYMLEWATIKPLC